MPWAEFWQAFRPTTAWRRRFRPQAVIRLVGYAVIPHFGVLKSSDYGLETGFAPLGRSPYLSVGKNTSF